MIEAPAPTIPAGTPAEAPAPVSPPAPTVGWQPGMARPLSPDDKQKWDAKIDRALTTAKEFHPQWQRGLDSYAKAKVPKAKKDVDALLHYRHVETKKAALFYRTPEVTLSPIDGPQDQAVPLDAVLPLRQKFLNYELSEDGADLLRAVHKTLIDALAASGFLICKIGYEDVKLPVPPDPMTGVQPTGPDGKPAQVPVWSRRFITAVSAKKLLIPADFHDTDYDAAPWLSVRGTMLVTVARRNGWAIPPEFAGAVSKDESIYEHAVADADASEAICEYTEIWYRASLFDPAVFNPELYRCLILVKGCDDPVWHVDSPYQSLTPEGALTDDSMVGNPIHVGTLRDLLDSAYVPSDLVVGEQLATELNNFRTDLVKNRKSRRPITLISDVIGPDKAQAILDDRGGVVPGEFIGEGGAQRLVAVVQAGSEPRDNFTAQEYVQHDHEDALGVGPNQAGNLAQTKRTATEIRNVQGNSSARAGTEKDRIKRFTKRLIRKFDAVGQRTATQTDVTKVLGQAGAQLWAQWKVLPGRYTYTFVPDSGQHIDAQQDRVQTLDEYNLLRKDDRVSTDALLKKVGRVLNYDPTTFIAPQQDKTIEPPKVSVAVNLIDLNDPVAGRMALDLFANEGVKISPDTIALMKAAHINAVVNGTAGQPVGATASGDAHGGAMTPSEKINQHQSEKTGGVNGVAA